jgi:hypothetical protein
MGDLYIVVSDSRKAYFELNKFAGYSIKWDLIYNRPATVADQIFRYYQSFGNNSFDYAWCEALVRYVAKLIPPCTDIKVVCDTSDEEYELITDTYTKVGSRFDPQINPGDT